MSNEGIQLINGQRNENKNKKTLLTQLTGKN